ncbi:hypothetical protein HIM_11422 [Hirsutella minnesotensis 3608]|uniref:Transcription factor domain-containing protein n=1 Tax=Hirsutella minnesotensis 3608 TaxID=1043627 RepID=A0A0F8A180_9HYPO|nr:hypothetical protein HIM_11422 [Hirsutella minnesotensis 3608]
MGSFEPESTPSSSARIAEDAPAPYCDNRLSRLRIVNWTTVPVSNEFAAGAISLYLETDQPILGLFDADLFVQDLVEPRSRFCSSLLVNALLYWACQAYASVNQHAIAFGHSFFVEADNLWSLEQKNDSLTTVSAAQFLGIGSVYYGKDGGLPYLSQGMKMAQRMKLLGVPDTITEQALTLEPQGEWLRAMSCTAWGVFNWATMRSFLFQEEDLSIRYPPTLPIPRFEKECSDLWEGDKRPTSQPKSRLSSTFPTLCEFWTITSSWVLAYYKHEHKLPIEGISLEYAKSVYQKLLSWSDELPAMLARGDQCTDHAATMHIWFHVSIISIFRPFSNPLAQRPVSLVTSRNHYPREIYTASLNQLKHMIRVFDCKYSSSSYGVLWHVALLHVANAMVADVNEPERLPYFMLCISCYQDLLRSYRVVHAVIKGLLSMAWGKGVISSSMAQSILQEVQRNGKGHTALDNIKSTFVADLDLALIDASAAQVETLAESFDAMSMLEDMTVGTDYVIARD